MKSEPKEMQFQRKIHETNITTSDHYAGDVFISFFCIGAYFLVTVYPNRQRTPLINSGDSITGILLQEESNYFSMVTGREILLTASGRVFSRAPDTSKVFEYHGKLSSIDFEKISAFIQDHDIRLKTYQDINMDGSTISLRLHFKSNRAVSTSLYGESRNQNFMYVYNEIEKLALPMLSNTVTMTEADLQEFNAICQTQCYGNVDLVD